MADEPGWQRARPTIPAVVAVGSEVASKSRLPRCCPRQVGSLLARNFTYVYARLRTLARKAARLLSRMESNSRSVPLVPLLREMLDTRVLDIPFDNL